MKYVAKSRSRTGVSATLPFDRRKAVLHALGVDVAHVRASVQAEIDAATQDALAAPMPYPALPHRGLVLRGLCRSR